MADRKRKPSKREMRLISARELGEKVQSMPIRHKQGLSPLATAWARNLFERVGWCRSATFDQWELGFMRDTHPEREIMVWEIIARAYEAYLSEKPGCDKKRVLGTLASISLGGIPKKETPEWKRLKIIFRNVNQDVGRNSDAIVEQMAESLGVDLDDPDNSW